MFSRQLGAALNSTAQMDGFTLAGKKQKTSGGGLSSRLGGFETLRGLLFAVLALKLLARLEAHGLSRRNVDFFPGAGIPADSRFAGLHAEYTKAAEFDALTAAKRLLQRLENGLDSLLGLGAADVCGGHYRVYQIQLNHAILPHFRGRC